MGTPALDQFYGANAGYVAELLERAERDPAAVDERLRAELATLRGDSADALGDSRSAPAGRIVDAPATAGAGASALAQAIRTYGHLAARLDPLGQPPPGDPQLQAAAHGVDETRLARLPGSVVGGPIGAQEPTAAGAVRRLRETYSSTIGYEFSHLAAPDERAWLQQAVESGQFRPPQLAIDERGLLDRLTEVSAFERFLHRAYPGQTRFSIEGLGMLIPMLDELIVRASEAGTSTILLGMAHRGRLNVLAHVLGKPYEQILAGFEGRAAAQRVAPPGDQSEGWIGDVKYHAGRSFAYEPEEGGPVREVTVVMAPNPSHLEFVNPVVQGMARAADEDRRGPGLPLQDEVRSLAVLIHGDAAFMGQGVVAETLNLSRLAGYRTGGTLHLIANNQLGFTTDIADERSTLYASDLARGFEVPVIHVNADDPIACIAVMRLAVAYRSRFRRDVLIDLVGYRRWGHNEGDEPSFTQPRMYAAIATHPTVRELFAADLVRRRVLQEEEPRRLLNAGLDEFQRIREGVLAQKNGRTPAVDIEDVRAPSNRSSGGDRRTGPAGADSASASRPEGGVPLGWERLRALNESLLRLPDGFHLNPKLARPMTRRRAGFSTPDAPVDWGHAEALAFGTILQDGTPIRLTGQDALRGTFSHRHAAFFEASTGEPYTPLAHLADARASFDMRNSPLSESAVVGFEYGYSVQAPAALVLWEAQYGDFINGAQVIVDEFIASGQAKWGMRSGLVLLLPHAWEGQGPDHSGGRLERFLGLAAEDNIVVANCTTAAQYFFLLRRQAASLANDPRPLILMTPKSLLRHPLTASPSSEFAEGRGFAPLLDDARAADHPEDVRRVVLCSGKVWADAASHPARAETSALALVRLEQLYPFPADPLRELLGRYASAEEVVWLQEEPRNMGPWPWVKDQFQPLLSGQAPRYVGRPEMASPAEGWADVHADVQGRIVQAIFEREGP